MIKYSKFLILFFIYHGLYGQGFIENSLIMGVDHYAYDPNMMGGGVAVFDFNNDGFEDIYLTGGLNSDKLYENRGDGTFEDVTKKMRITALNIVKTMGVVAGDIDNDGFTDLLITTAENQHCYLLKNENGNAFNDISIPAGITHEAWSTTASMADYDLDGDLDIYVGNYVAFDGLPFDQHIIKAEADFFYQNDGNGHFIKINNPLASEKEGCTLVASFSDFDSDGDADLFVLNDFGDFYESNKLLLNDTSTGTFEDISEISGMNAEINSMGIAPGDFNEDGYLDYYLTNIGDNLLYQGSAEGIFEDVSHLQQVNDGIGVSWGTAFMDVNNDGYLDLFVAKGSLLAIDEAQENRLYLYNPNVDTFEEASEFQQLNDPHKARGMAYGDFNNDGKLDIVVSNLRILPENSGNTLVYSNANTDDKHWVKFALEGTHTNKSAYGTILKLYTANRQMIREISGGSSYLSHHSTKGHFGLGNIQHIDSIVVNWQRDGLAKEVFHDLAVDATYTIKENEGIFITRSESITICEGETIFLEGALQNKAGVYRDIISNPEIGGIDTLVITRLTVKDDCLDTISGITGLLVFPNPFDKTLMLYRDASGTEELLKITLNSSAGKIIRVDHIQWNAASETIEIPGYESLPQGVYIIHINYKGKTHTQKLIKS